MANPSAPGPQGNAAGARHTTRQPDAATGHAWLLFGGLARRPLQKRRGVAEQTRLADAAPLLSSFNSLKLRSLINVPSHARRLYAARAKSLIAPMTRANCSSLNPLEQGRLKASLFNLSATVH